MLIILSLTATPDHIHKGASSVQATYTGIEITEYTCTLYLSE